MNNDVQVKNSVAPKPVNFGSNKTRFAKRKSPSQRHEKNPTRRVEVNRAVSPQAQTRGLSDLINERLKARRFSELLKAHTDLIALQSEEDEEDYVYKPTDYAFNTAVELLRVAYLSARDNISRPAVTPDGVGGSQSGVLLAPE